MKTTTAREIMTDRVISIGPDQMVTEAMKLMLRWHISGLPVVDEAGGLAGIITEIDVVNLAVDGNAGDTRVGDVMSREVVTFGPDATVCDMVKCFSAQRLRRVPIVKDGRVLGIVSRRDILRDMLERY